MNFFAVWKRSKLTLLEIPVCYSCDFVPSNQLDEYTKLIAHMLRPQAECTHRTTGLSFLCLSMRTVFLSYTVDMVCRLLLLNAEIKYCKRDEYDIRLKVTFNIGLHASNGELSSVHGRTSIREIGCWLMRRMNRSAIKSIYYIQNVIRCC